VSFDAEELARGILEEFAERESYRWLLDSGKQFLPGEPLKPRRTLGWSVYKRPKTFDRKAYKKAYRAKNRRERKPRPADYDPERRESREQRNQRERANQAQRTAYMREYRRRKRGVNVG
jgi:ribosomal protein S4